MITINLEIFARVLFSGNFKDAKFCKNKTLVKWNKNLSFIDVGKSYPTIVAKF